MGALREQHERWAGARERLANSLPPPVKPRAPRPVSPFRRDKIAAMRAELEKAAEVDPAVINIFPHLFTTVQASYPPSATVSPTVFLPDGIPLSWRTIVAGVCRKHRVSLIDLRSPRRDHPTVLARHEAFWCLRKQTTMSLPAIGRMLGGRDHTTVIAGIRQHEKRMQESASA